ncbi:unnamed protein product, partial [Polarella glacialis]
LSTNSTPPQPDEVHAGDLPPAAVDSDDVPTELDSDDDADIAYDKAQPKRRRSLKALAAALRLRL